jgi:hypothetical protein
MPLEFVTPAGAPEPKILGLDTGVKGAWFLTGLDQPAFGTWDMSGAEPHADALYSALQRGTLIAQTVLSHLHVQVPIAIDTPMFTGDKNPYGWGLQCLLFGALCGVLRGRGLEVIPIKGKTARKLLCIKGNGKLPIVEWAEPRIGNGIGKLPKWKLEAVCEAFMLAEAAKIYRRGQSA